MALLFGVTFGPLIFGNSQNNRLDCEILLAAPPNAVQKLSCLGSVRRSQRSSYGLRVCFREAFTWSRCGVTTRTYGCELHVQFRNVRELSPGRLIRGSYFRIPWAMGPRRERVWRAGVGAADPDAGGPP